MERLDAQEGMAEHSLCSAMGGILRGIWEGSLIKQDGKAG